MKCHEAMGGCSGNGCYGIPPCIPCKGDVTKPDGKGEVNFHLVECLVKGIVYSDIYREYVYVC